MKRLLVAASAAMLVAAGVLLPFTAASGGPIEALDAGVETTSPLTEISPAGNYGVFAVTATLSGATAATLTITDQVAGGAIDQFASVLGECSSAQVDSAGVLTCHVALDPSTRPSATIHVAVRSALTATEVVNTASVAMQSPGDDTVLGVDINPDNDESSATTPVTAGGPSAGFVPVGHSISFSAHGQHHLLTVTEARGAGNGALVTMSDPGLMACGSQSCQGVHIEFSQGQDGGFYEAGTQVDSSGSHDPCRGLGTDKCTPIYWRKLPTDALVPMPACGTEGPDDPCLRAKFKTDGGRIHYLTEMDTDDPDIGLPGVPPPTGVS